MAAPQSKTAAAGAVTPVAATLSVIWKRGQYQAAGKPACGPGTKVDVPRADAQRYIDLGLCIAAGEPEEAVQVQTGEALSITPADGPSVQVS